MPSLAELAKVIRSKNAKPFVLTVDIMFEHDEAYDRVANSGAVSPTEVARRYGVAEATVQVFLYPAARAIKVTFPRADPAGSFADRDLIGAQQAVPLLTIDIP
jgi:hypothetical protein